MDKKYMLRKSPINDIVKLTATGVGLGLGAKAVSSAGGDASGLTAFSSFQPAMGTIMGAGATIGMVNNIAKPFTKKRR